MKMNENIRMDFDFNKAGNMDEIISRLFNKRRGLNNKRGGLFIKRISKEQTTYDRESLLDDEMTYRMGQRRKLIMKSSLESPAFQNKLNQFKQSRVASHSEGALVGEQELYFNIVSQKMTVALQDTWIIYIPQIFYAQAFSKLTKDHYSRLSRNLFVENGLFGCAKLSVDLIAALLGSFAEVTMRRGEQIRESRGSAKEGQYVYVLCDGSVKVSVARTNGSSQDVKDQVVSRLDLSRAEFLKNRPRGAGCGPKNTHEMLLESFSVINPAALLEVKDANFEKDLLELVYTVESLNAQLLKIPAWIVNRFLNNNQMLNERLFLFRDHFQKVLSGKKTEPQLQKWKCSKTSDFNSHPKSFLRAKQTCNSSKVSEAAMIVNNTIALSQIHRQTKAQLNAHKARLFGKETLQRQALNQESKSMLRNTSKPSETSKSLCQETDLRYKNRQLNEVPVSRKRKLSTKTTFLASRDKNSFADLFSNENSTGYSVFDCDKLSLKLSNAKVHDIIEKPPRPKEPQVTRKHTSSKPFSSFSFIRCTLHENTSKAALETNIGLFRTSLQKTLNPLRAARNTSDLPLSRSQDLLNTQSTLLACSSLSLTSEAASLPGQPRGMADRRHGRQTADELILIDQSVRGRHARPSAGVNKLIARVMSSQGQRDLRLMTRNCKPYIENDSYANEKRLRIQARSNKLIT